jgi:peptidoglycan hydrolase CwlO-like protein
MEYVFIGLAIGCGIFLFKIVSDYLAETPVWQMKIEQAVGEREQYEAQLESMMASKDDTAAHVKKIDGEIKTMEQMRDELKIQVETTKKEMARQGKIIMKRQPSE